MIIVIVRMTKIVLLIVLLIVIVGLLCPSEALCTVVCVCVVCVRLCCHAECVN